MAGFQRTTPWAHEMLERPPLKQTKDGRPFGRPCEYKPEYADLVIQDMAKGYSLAAFAGLVGVCRDTVYEWTRTQPDFSFAVKRAAQSRQRAWEKKLIQAEKGGEVASAIFGLKNVAPMDWQDFRQVQHSHDHTIHKLTRDQLLAIASQSSRVIEHSPISSDGDCGFTEDSDT